MIGSGTSFIQNALSETLGVDISVKSSNGVSGGCINNAVKVDTSEGVYFVKWHASIPDDMFEKEARGLELLAKAGTIQVPKVFGYGKTKAAV